MFPILNPAPTSLPIPSLWVIPVHQPQASCTLHHHSSILAWRIPGRGEPGGLPSVGSHRIGHDWCDLAAAAASPALVFFSPNCRCVVVFTGCWLPLYNLSLTSGIRYIFYSQFQITDIILRQGKFNLEFYCGKVLNFNWKIVNINHLAWWQHIASCC